MVQVARPRRLFDAGAFGLGGAASSRFRPVEKAGERHEPPPPREERSGGGGRGRREKEEGARRGRASVPRALLMHARLRCDEKQEGLGALAAHVPAAALFGKLWPYPAATWPLLWCTGYDRSIFPMATNPFSIPQQQAQQAAQQGAAPGPARGQPGARPAAAGGRAGAAAAPPQQQQNGIGNAYDDLGPAFATQMVSGCLATRLSFGCPASLRCAARRACPGTASIDAAGTVMAPWCHGLCRVTLLAG